MKNLMLIIVLLTGLGTFAQGVSVQGNVLDGEVNNEPLAFANIKVKGLNIGTETSISGNFELELLEGSYDLVIEFIGYAPVEIRNVVVSKEKVILNPVILSSHQLVFDMASASEEETSDEKSE